MKLNEMAKIGLSVLFPVLLNNMINLSEQYYFKQWQADIADVLIVIGAVMLIFVQSYGSYQFFSMLETWRKQ